MHGPGGIYSPTYPNIPTIDVFDRVAPSLRPRKKKRWRRHRDEGLALWSDAGLRFDVVETTPYTFVGFGEPDWPVSTSETVQPIVVGAIVLCRSRYTPPAPKYWQTAWSTWQRGGGVAFFHLERLKASEKMGATTNAWYRTICHEVGHTLGLGHGGTGIMSGGMTPNDHDLDSLRDYWGT